LDINIIALNGKDLIVGVVVVCGHHCY